MMYISINLNLKTAVLVGIIGGLVYALAEKTKEVEVLKTKGV